MNRSVKIGSVFSIDLRLSYSWFLIFALVTWGLTAVLFPQAAPGLSMTAYIIMGVVTSLLFFGSVLFHEIMHSLVAKRYGLPIEGITLLAFGGVSQLTEEPQTPDVEFKMAIAGPLSSLFLGVLFLGVFFAGNRLNFGPLILAPALWLGYINVILGLFNLLPGFPLDGGRVLRSAIWHFTGNIRHATGVAAGFGKGLAYILILLGIIGPVAGSITLAWFIFLGWILLQAADSGYQQIIYREALEGIKVGQAMTQNPETVDPDINIEEMVKEHFMQHQWIAYPVVKDEDVKGVITIKSIENLPRRSWKRKRVRDVMRPLSLDIVTQPEAEVSEVLPKLNAKAEGRILVMRSGRLIGILTKVDIGKAIIRRLRSQQEQERPAA